MAIYSDLLWRFGSAVASVCYSLVCRSLLEVGSAARVVGREQMFLDTFERVMPNCRSGRAATTSEAREAGHSVTAMARPEITGPLSSIREAQFRKEAE
jgi:hypothetical protein